ncbi:MAG: beta strand repeat-containing protein, partial [Flavobacteriales bacterium]
MKRILPLLSRLAVVTCILLFSSKAMATTCPNASVISPASLPIVGQAVSCGATDDINSLSAAASVLTGGCNSTLYYGGWEALYSFTPTASGQYDVSYAGQTYTGIFVFNGCPTTGGSTCVGGIANSTASKSVTVTLTAGVTYYIMFDTWPTPQSPCPGNFSLTQILPNTATATINGGLWSSPQTWVSGVVPNAASTVVIPSGSIVVVDQVTNIASLDVTGNLQWNATSNAMTVLGNITVNAGGKFLPYTTSTGGTTSVTINIGGDFINNGYCNFAAGTSSAGFLNFNGSQQVGGSLTQTLGGSGTFEGNGIKGIIRALGFQTTGSSTINTTQDLITMNLAHTNGSLNTNGKLTIDNTAQCYGQAINTQVASVSVTNMGSLYSTAPVVCGVAVTPYASGALANLGTRYFFGNNVYLCTSGGTFNATPPTSNTLNATFTTSGPTLIYIGTLGTLGANVPYNSALSLTTPYFYGDNWYQAVVATATTTMPTHVAGTVGNFRYLGPAAKVSVNFDPATQTVRSLTLTNPGSGWNSATAPSLVFSAGATGATGAGAAATSVVLYNLNGPLNSIIQKSGISTFSGGLTINSDQGASVASGDPQASSGVGNIYTTNGGLNYTVAPTVGFAGPPALNLVTNQGSGYTTAPTVTVAGGTLISGTALTSTNFTVTVAQGKVISVYLNSGTTATYSVPPTISLSAGTATIAWPANCWPAATANIGSNGQLLSFTVTNPGYGYAAAPTVGIGTVSGTAAGGTFTTVATAPTARIALYNVTLANFTPTTTLAVQNDIDIFPPNRKINALSLSTGGIGLNLANNLMLIGTSPLILTASPNNNGNVLNLNGNTLTTTWNQYAGTLSTFGASNAYLQNGSMALYHRGGGTIGTTYNFPFSATFSTNTGNGTGGATTGSDFTRLVVTETAAPSNALTTGTGLSFGNRAFRLEGFTTGTTAG